MRIRTRHVVLGVVFSATALPVFADPITIVSLRRTVLIQAAAGDASGTEQLSDRSFLSDTMIRTSGPNTVRAGGSLDTTDMAELGEIAATGGTFIDHNSTTAGSGGFVQSTFVVDFDVNETQAYFFGGNFFTSGNDDLHRSLFFAELAGPTRLFFFAGGSHISPLSRGLLTPGRYRLLASSLSIVPSQIGSGRTDSSFNVALGFADPGVAATPEPASMVLLGTGLVGLVAHRRRQRRA